MQTKGIVLIACGHQNYGYMAANLAMSIKYNTPGINITLLCNNSAIKELNEQWRSFFDSIIEMPKQTYQVNGFNQPIKSKLYLYELSPYDTTIFIDADVILTKGANLNNLFDEIESVDFTMQNRGAKKITDNFLPNECFWMNIEDAKKAYSFTDGLYYKLASEFIYFKKTEQVKQLFDDAIKAYEKPLINFIPFSGGIADEAVFSISMLQNNIYPHKENFTPVYWEQMEKKRYRGDVLNNQFYGYSIGGSSMGDLEKKVYDNYVQFYCNQNGFYNQFKAKPKASFNPDRQLI